MSGVGKVEQSWIPENMISEQTRYFEFDDKHELEETKAEQDARLGIANQIETMQQQINLGKAVPELEQQVNEILERSICQLE